MMNLLETLISVKVCDMPFSLSPESLLGAGEKKHDYAYLS